MKLDDLQHRPRDLRAIDITCREISPKSFVIIIIITDRILGETENTTSAVHSGKP